jgi:1-acyl-sn-glycerol-3-phosphate acyltransferase
VKTGKKGILYNVVQVFRTVWTFAAFTSAMLLVQPGTYLYFLFGRTTERKRMKFHRFLCGVSHWAVKRIPGTRFSSGNPYGETFERPAVIVCNHQSHLDLVCIMMLSPKIVVLTNDWVWNCPFYNIIIHRAEFYPVSDGMDRNTERLRGLVARGYSVVVFPEGTRSADCKVGRFHVGAYQLARELGVDILPLTLYGTGKVLPKHSVILRPGHMHIEVGRRYAADAPARELAKAGRAACIDSYKRLCNKFENGDGG